MNPPARRHAVIYIPPGVDVGRWQKACLKHCNRRGYKLVSLVVDEDGTKWHDVIRMNASGESDIIVIFDWNAMPPDRLPRVEEVGVENSGDVPRQRRPRLFRRH